MYKQGKSTLTGGWKRRLFLLHASGWLSYHDVDATIPAGDAVAASAAASSTSTPLGIIPLKDPGLRILRTGMIPISAVTSSPPARIETASMLGPVDTYYSFQIKTPLRTYFLCCETRQQMEMWMTTIGRLLADFRYFTEVDEGMESSTTTATTSATTNNSNKSPETQSESSGVATMATPDELASLCFYCRTPFTLLTRRHHCRRCGNCCCVQCCPKRIGHDRVCLVCSKK